MSCALFNTFDFDEFPLLPNNVLVSFHLNAMGLMLYFIETVLLLETKAIFPAHTKCDVIEKFGRNGLQECQVLTFIHFVFGRIFIVRLIACDDTNRMLFLKTTGYRLTDYSYTLKSLALN